MINAKDLIKANLLTIEEIEKLAEDLKIEARQRKQEKYLQKVEDVRELLKEMAEIYPLELAIEGDGIRVERDLNWEELEMLFSDTDRTL